MTIEEIKRLLDALPKNGRVTLNFSIELTQETHKNAAIDDDLNDSIVRTKFCSVAKAAKFLIAAGIKGCSPANIRRLLKKENELRFKLTDDGVYQIYTESLVEYRNARAPQCTCPALLVLDKGGQMVVEHEPHCDKYEPNRKPK